MTVVLHQIAYIPRRPDLLAQCCSSEGLECNLGITRVAMHSTTMHCHKYSAVLGLRADRGHSLFIQHSLNKKMLPTYSCEQDNLSPSWPLAVSRLAWGCRGKALRPPNAATGCLSVGGQWGMSILIGGFTEGQKADCHSPPEPTPPAG